MTLENKISREFSNRFHKKPTLILAPARINLIGEHVDYNGGFVMPAAIDKHFIFALSPSGNDKCNVFADDLEEGVSFSIHDLNPGEAWINYLMGVLDGVDRKGHLKQGIDCVFGSNIPSGAGLSSSAALCCGFGFGLNEAFGLGLDKKTIALIAQHAEREFVGANVGIMDQYSSLFGEKDAVLLLDCQNLSHETIPFHFPGYSILLADTRVKHSLASTAYNDRREACEHGVSIIQKKHSEVRSLRDVSGEVLVSHKSELSDDVFAKCMFVVEEIERTKKAAILLKEKNLDGFGDLMYETHHGLSKVYDVSCAELDYLVSLAEEDKKTVVGSRMMGGGFGGCTINIIRSDAQESFRKRVSQHYFATFKKEPDFYSVALSEGVHRIKIKS